MRYLIDTHILIWYLDGNKRLPDKIKQIINDEDNTVIVSVVSLWEFSIKLKLGKLDVDLTLQEIQTHLLKTNYTLINISFDHLKELLVMPHHHGDPFDHLLIAQAISEDLTIISADKHFAAYPAKVIWQ
jgi:PIN domain nuclease of toxin-antitoxin system